MKFIKGRLKGLRPLMVGMYIHIMERESLIGSLRGASPLFLTTSPSPLKERGIQGVR